MSLAHYGLIGNCQLSALVHKSGAIAWACMPRFDSPPVFASLLDENAGGHFTIGSADGSEGVQRYLPNTNVLETRFQSGGSKFRVLDFAPRFIQYSRTFRPTQIVRIVEPLEGTPRIHVRCQPVLGWSRQPPQRDLGSHHITYHGFASQLRLTTDAPLSYLDGEPFALSGKLHFILTWGTPVEEPLEPLCDRFLNETVQHWQQWVKQCDIPAQFQDEVIRSALALKLHCFEDTGAIVAAMTTSLPEAPNTERNWDYRYCWLRDAYYTLGAFRLLGHFEEREQFIHYLLNVASTATDLNLAPLYRIDGRSNLGEEILKEWPGYQRMGPVRIGNQAAEHRQNDVFGEMVLALVPLFFDARFREQVTKPVVELVSSLARKAIQVASEPDAGIWEFRSQWRRQTFSTLMCWAAADRMSRIAESLQLTSADEFATAAARIRNELLEGAVDHSRNTLVADFGGKEVDASLLQAMRLRLVAPSDPIAMGTLEAVRTDLAMNGYIRRYRIDDGFGVPQVAFTLCSLWMVEALSTLNRRVEALELMQRILRIRSPLGLLSEDVDTVNGEMWGNYPQAYSHAGMIHAAFAASTRWADVE